MFAKFIGELLNKPHLRKEGYCVILEQRTIQVMAGPVLCLKGDMSVSLSCLCHVMINDGFVIIPIYSRRSQFSDYGANT